MPDRCQPRAQIRDLLGGQLLRFAAEHLAGVDDDRGADVAGHHDRRPQVRRVEPEVGDATPR